MTFRFHCARSRAAVPGRSASSVVAGRPPAGSRTPDLSVLIVTGGMPYQRNRPQMSAQRPRTRVAQPMDNERSRMESDDSFRFQSRQPEVSACLPPVWTTTLTPETAPCVIAANAKPVRRIVAFVTSSIARCRRSWMRGRSLKCGRWQSTSPSEIRLLVATLSNLVRIAMLVSGNPA